MGDTVGLVLGEIVGNWVGTEVVGISVGEVEGVNVGQGPQNPKSSAGCTNGIAKQSCTLSASVAPTKQKTTPSMPGSDSQVSTGSQFSRGSSVGDRVGLAVVGMADGLDVGESVTGGEKLGRDDGDGVGSVGEAVGVSVGSGVGHGPQNPRPALSSSRTSSTETQTSV